MMIRSEVAREIMGSNMLGTIEVKRYFGKLTDEQQKTLELIPFSEETLRACAKTRILVADVGLSLLDIRKKTRDGLFHKEDWYKGQEFANRTETARWRLIRKTPVSNAFFQSWNEQGRRINSEIDEIPSARQVVYTIILHFLATREWIFEKVFVRTSDIESVALLGEHISIGSFGENNLSVCTYLDGCRLGYLSIATARKS